MEVKPLSPIVKCNLRLLKTIRNSSSSIHENWLSLETRLKDLKDYFETTFLAHCLNIPNLRL